MCKEEAVASTNDRATVSRLLKSFFFPYIELRNRRRGYAVSIVKAGLRVVGRDAGKVRPPLVDLTSTEMSVLEKIIEAVS